MKLLIIVYGFIAALDAVEVVLWISRGNPVWVLVDAFFCAWFSWMTVREWRKYQARISRNPS